MHNKTYRYILIAVIVAASIASGYLAFQRNTLEKANKQVEIALLYDEVARLAELNGKSTGEVLSDLKSTGVTGILFKEESLEALFRRDSLMKLEGGTNVAIVSGNVLTSAAEIFLDEFVDEIYPGYVYLIITNDDTYNRIKKHLQAKIPPEVLHFPENTGGLYLIGVSPAYGEVMAAKKVSVGLGFSQEQLQEVAGEGYNILLQVGSWLSTDGESIRKVFDLYNMEMAPYRDRLSLIAFNDSVLPGFPAYIDILAEEIAGFNVPVGFVEDFIFKQAGIKELGKERNISKRMARLHSISAGEMLTYTSGEAVGRLLLAASERNVRVLLVRLFTSESPSMSLENNKNYLSTLVEQLRERGFTTGKADTFKADVTSQSARRLLILVIGMGTIAAGLLLADIIGMTRLGLLLALLATVGWIAVFLPPLLSPENNGNMLRMAIKLMTLAGVIIFPILAVTVTVKDKGMGLKQALLQFLKMTCISLIGALFLVGMLSHLHYMLKLDQFLGVKAGLILPLLAIPIIFYFREDGMKGLGKIKDLLYSNVNILMLGLFAILAAVILLLIVRAGNVGTITELEGQVRSALQELLYIRPRTKEFLIGHPLMLLLLYLGYKQKYLPLLILASIGQVSMVNTFAHIHTPLVVSIIRTFNGLWLGILGGLTLIGFYRFLTFMKGRSLDERNK